MLQVTPFTERARATQSERKPEGPIEAKVILYNRVVRSHRLSAAERAVYWYLLYERYNNKTGQCDPGKGDIVKGTVFFTMRTVTRALESLEKRGIIGVKRRKRSANVNETNSYTFPGLAELLALVKQAEAERGVVTPMSLGSDARVTRGSDANVTQTLESEPKKEPERESAGAHTHARGASRWNEQGKAREARGSFTALSKDWMPGIETMKQIEREFAYDDTDQLGERLLVPFIKHHTGNGNKSPDWNAKFYMWCKGQVGRDQRDRSLGSDESTGETIEDRRASTRRWREKSLRSLHDRKFLSADEYAQALAKFVEQADRHSSMEFDGFAVERDLDLQAKTNKHEREREQRQKAEELQRQEAEDRKRKAEEGERDNRLREQHKIDLYISLATGGGVMHDANNLQDESGCHYGFSDDVVDAAMRRLKAMPEAADALARLGGFSATWPMARRLAMERSGLIERRDNREAA